MAQAFRFVNVKPRDVPASSPTDGSAKIREVKIVAPWNADRRDSDNLTTSDPESISNCAAIESASTLETDKMVSVFARRVEREATRRDFQNAERQVVIGDGAKWTWNIASEHFPRAVQHLWDVGKEIYGVGTDLASQ